MEETSANSPPSPELASSAQDPSKPAHRSASASPNLETLWKVWKVNGESHTLLRESISPDSDSFARTAPSEGCFSMSSCRTDDSGYPSTQICPDSTEITADLDDSYLNRSSRLSGGSADSGYHSSVHKRRRSRRRGDPKRAPDCGKVSSSKSLPEADLRSENIRGEILGKTSHDTEDDYWGSFLEGPIYTPILYGQNNVRNHYVILPDLQAAASDSQGVTSAVKEFRRVLGEVEGSEASSRSPSPWQEANLAGGENAFDDALLRSLSWILTERSGGNTISRCSSSPSDSKMEFQVPEGLTAVAGGSSSDEPWRQPYVQGMAVSAPSSGYKSGNKRQPPPLDQRRGQDEDDDPGPKRLKSSDNTLERPFTRPRFACPYQKYDPTGSPFCCMPSAKNPDGGADTFPRIKSHMFRNHDPFVRCNKCWRMFKSEQFARTHERSEICVARPSPTKYWMTLEQRDQVREQRFIANNEANWYSLLAIVLPDVPAEGPGGYKQLSPYYVAGLTLPPTPASSSDSSGLRSNMSQLGPQREQDSSSTLDLTQLPPTQQSIAAGEPQSGSGQVSTMAVDGQPEMPTSTLHQGAALDQIMTDEAFWQDPFFFGPADDRTLQFDTSGAGQLTHGSVATSNAQEQPRTEFELSVVDLRSNVRGATRPHDQTPAQGNYDFLRRDHERLRSDNAFLRDENHTMRLQQTGMQVQLNAARAQLGPLETALQELLYLPELHNTAGPSETVSRVFSIMELMAGVKKSLMADVRGKKAG